MTTKRVKKIKAWAVIVFGDMLSTCFSQEMIQARAVFTDAGEARLFREKFKNADGTYAQDAKIVTVTLTYKSPSKPRTAAKRIAPKRPKHTK